MRRCVRHGMFAVAWTTEGRPQSPQAMEDDMHLTRRKVLHLGGAAALAYPSIALAQPYPARPVRVIVGFPPGGGYDILARLIGQWLTERLGQAFIIENRPSAGGNIGTETVVKAAADGYTLLLCGASNTINTTLYDRLSFNFTRDIAPVAGVTRSPLVLQVHPSVPVKTLPEFIAYAKANPGKIDMGSAGNGTPQHVSGELFKMMTGLNITHVPYRGSGPALIGVLGAQVHVLFEIDDIVDRVHQDRQAAPAGGDHRDPLAGAPGRPDGERVRAGLRGELMVWDRCAEEHARRDRRQAQPGGQCLPRRGESKGALRRDGGDSVCRDTRRVRQVHLGRYREVGQGHQVLEHQGGLIPVPRSGGAPKRTP